MRNLLSQLPSPAHYAGIEEGIILKNQDEVSLRIALAFPDTYEIGMSYLGQKILYNIINNHAEWQAERVMAPEKAASSIMRATETPLCSLETGTPLHEMAAIGFAITHELCYTNVLYMLDLAGIPLRTQNRPRSIFKCPIIMAGGGAVIGAEPLAPFMDLILLGDGEEVVPEVLELLATARQENWSRQKFLLAASEIPGVYVPSLFEMAADGHCKALKENYRPVRRIVSDLNNAPYPVRQVIPVGAVHNRLSLEIARGCGNGCRFCQAGMVYRPMRERKLENLEQLLNHCLDETGFEEVSFLSLSAGDFSGLQTLWEQTWDRCQKEQITLSLPSLRVGSVNDEIMAKMAALRRVGCTLAPEAGSQRLRDIINKGITEEALLEHIQKLLAHGWQQVKLYFMIGLPGETTADLDAILHLCRKVRDAGGKELPKMRVTASISPFVPKPFTPFQWEAQAGLEEISARINYCRELFNHERLLTLRWHDPKSSHLEGVLARADRRMADVVEKAYKKGAIFCNWAEAFNLDPWLEAMAECQINPQDYIGARDLTQILPWDHLEAGIDKKFLLRERKLAYQGKTTKDCRSGTCNMCGACDTPAAPSLLTHNRKHGQHYGLKLLFDKSDQSRNPAISKPDSIGPRPGFKKGKSPNRNYFFRIWHSKMGNFAYLSQLELQAVIFRALRRAKFPVAFSQGFHPMPLISFGRALPVGCQSEMEWFSLGLKTFVQPHKIRTGLNIFLAAELACEKVEIVEKKQKTAQSISENFIVETERQEDAIKSFEKFQELTSCEFKKISNKGEKTINLRPFLLNWQIVDAQRIAFTTDWLAGYVSPLILLQGVFTTVDKDLFKNASLIKVGQIFESGQRYVKNG